jgi:hypothetical protein
MTNREIGDPCDKCGDKLVHIDYGDDFSVCCLTCLKNSDVDEGPFRSWEGMVKTMFRESVKILLDNSLTDLEWTYAKNCIHTGLRYFESKRMDEKLTPKRPARDFNEFLLQFVNYLDTFRNQIVLEDCEKFGGRSMPESVRLVMDVNIFEASIKDFLQARGIKIEDISSTT